jgi:hypothetical protein
MIASQPSKAARSGRRWVQSSTSNLKPRWCRNGSMFAIEPYDMSSTPTTS